MLKIKNNIDLKELEKFGFKKEKNIYCFKNIFHSTVLIVFIDNRKISNASDDPGNETLYNLIQSGLVEVGD